MKKTTRYLALLFNITLISFTPSLEVNDSNSWIRINLLGYQPQSSKVAVWASKTNQIPEKFELIDTQTGTIVYTSSHIKSFGAYGPFTATARLQFSDFKKPGKYVLRMGGITSPTIIINDEVYRHSADFALRYMRQQRSGFNPYLNDSCHTHDGFALYGAKAGIKDSTHFDASGGWHDASDYLQYTTTTANATRQLLMAYDEFPKAFADQKLANGLEGTNGQADVLDEAKWGLEWLIKMHPKPHLMFNQLADDRDHLSMRIPKEDSQYGKGFERPLYFINGEPQQRGKFLNNTTGTSSTAAKLSSAFALGSKVFAQTPGNFAQLLKIKAESALAFANLKKGVTQTVSVKSPYIYAEDNWVDDMELAYASISLAKPQPRKKDFDLAFDYAQQEKITPWLITDTAKHYQYYPFVNIGHYELGRQYPRRQSELADFYQQGILQVWERAQKNAFYRGVPFIWCSNNLTVAFVQQCYWYRKMSGNETFSELEQANFDWLLGCNPWGTSMVYGLPSWGDTPTDPHSAFTHLKNYPIDGGLVDGPVYTSIYKNLIGIQLTKPDAYAEFQSNLAVYHDDYGDYSTNEPTMDGTASLIYILAAFDSRTRTFPKAFEISQGAITRGPTNEKKIALVFTADEFADDGENIKNTLDANHVKASFFLTGRGYRNTKFNKLIKSLKQNGNYLGPHSNAHLLYADWAKRDSLLVTEKQFKLDLIENYKAMEKFGIKTVDAPYFLPPYEWYNQKIADWTHDLDKQLINFTAGTRSNADYTYPELGKAYRTNEEIYQSIVKYEKSNENGLNGFILLLHLGTDPRRKDKFHHRLPELLKYLKQNGYEMVKIDELLKPTH